MFLRRLSSSTAILLASSSSSVGCCSAVTLESIFGGEGELCETVEGAGGLACTATGLTLRRGTGSSMNGSAGWVEEDMLTGGTENRFCCVWPLALSEDSTV